MKPCRKRSNISSDDVDKDRISMLPDDIIGHMLSFLPTKHAVGTSALSASWEKLWTTIHNFHFDDQLLFDSQNYLVDQKSPRTEYIQQCVQCRSNFIHLVNRAFSQTMGSALSSFYLRICHPIVKDEFELLKVWLHEALSRGVRQIDFLVPCLLHDPQLMENLLVNFVTSTNLEVLRLGEAFILEIPHNVSPLNLKVLHLYRINMSSDTANRLVSSCPRLEDLSLDLVIMTDMAGLNISAPVLEKLRLFIYPPRRGYKIVLDTPRLTFLDFHDRSLSNNYSDLSIKCLHSLVQAEIEIRDYYFRPPEAIINVLYILAERVQVLYLPFVTLQVFICGYHTWPQFQSLIYLEFSSLVHFDAITLGCLIYSAVNLQTLVFKKGFISEKSGTNWFRDELLLFKAQKRPAYFIHLKVISIGSFIGDETFIEGLNYLIKKAVFLKKLEVSESCSLVEATMCSSLIEKLSTLPLPRNCELVVV